jgi:hypothetical protein
MDSSLWDSYLLQSSNYKEKNDFFLIPEQAAKFYETRTSDLLRHYELPTILRLSN